MRLDYQDLRRRGAIAPYGRAWLFVASWSFRLCWAMGESFCGIELVVDDDRGVTLHLSVPGIALWFGLDAPWARRLASRGERALGVTVHDWCIWWHLWSPRDSWSREMPRWRDGHLDVAALLVGRITYSSRTLSIVESVVPMPEGAYPARVTLVERAWHRPRWFTKRWLCAEVEPSIPIPHAGKGENPWDCGQDALHAWSGPASTIEEATTACARSVLAARRKYDGDVNARYPAPVVASA